ncbi:hypothetical protein GQ43DRAFT_437528 [Delitschia confertaspora ATCC 74209]|uniref:Uncharacterized protein n=1 Tax=Delitschia confertaspora ATCC 74209 TaxID=1513339 RepID=A0A9P4MT65_9PLEO|nr:hypothetical protein GQ43DRAFT_437528 [Delitschia confertaspora ATCC 74209]
MAAEFPFYNGANRFSMIDPIYCLGYMKEKYPHLKMADFSKLPKEELVISKLKEMCDGRDEDIPIECVTEEYAKGWTRYLKMKSRLGRETSKNSNEMITSTSNFSL